MSDLESTHMYINRSQDALISLQQFGDCIARVNVDEKHWKYALIAIHNALQGFMAVSLRGQSLTDTWKNGDDKDRWHNPAVPAEERKIPHLDYFNNLGKNTFDKSDGIDWKPLELLNSRRNDFIHFNTDGQYLERAGLVPMCAQALKAIQVAKSKASGIVFYNTGEEEEYEEAMKRAQELLSAVRHPEPSPA